MSEPASWYYVGTFGQLGPLTLEQMEELIEGSVIENGTYVWKPGMNDWLPAASLVDLMNSFKLIEPFSSPPPTPTPTPPQIPIQSPASRSTSSQHQPRPANTPIQTYAYNRQLVLPKSDKNRTLSGLLQIFFPGLGRMYMGYAALGVIQLMVAFFTCGAGCIWSIIDGILILGGAVRIDGYGRALED